MAEQAETPAWQQAIKEEWERRHGSEEALESKYEDEQGDMKFRYPLMARAFSSKEVTAVVESVLTGQLTMSHKVKEFEKKFAEYVGSPYAVMVNSGSSANLLALSVACNPARLGRLPKGSECLCPAVCWSTSLWPIIQMGLVPVLVDVDPNTLQIDIADLQRKVSKNTSSILLVHVLGNVGDMNSVMSIVDAHKLCLIEDTCESLGASYDDKKLGTIGDFGTYSFYFSHHITTGEGGMVTCKTLEDYDLLKCLRAHGWSRDLSNKKELEAKYSHMDPRFLFVNLGYNLRPMEISGAMGILQLEGLPKANGVRNENRQRIEAAMRAHPKFNGQLDSVLIVPKADPAWFGYSVLVNSRFRHQYSALIKYLTANGVENRPIISGNFARQPSLELLDLKVTAEDFPGAEQVGSCGLFVGVHTTPLKDEQVDFLVETFMKFPWDARDKILVTGGTGLVGQALQAMVARASNPREEWLFLGSKDCDLTDLEATRLCWSINKPTHVIHLAVLLMDGQRMRERKVELWETNMRMNENVLKVCREHKVQKLVSCLSSYAYPAKLLDGATPESHLHQGAPHSPIETYAYAKRMLEVLSRCYREEYRCKFVTVLPTNIFGPYGSLRPTGPVVEGLIARTIGAQNTGEPLQLYGTGKPKRQFLFNKDLAQMLYWALREYDDAETLNLVGEEVAISEVVEYVTKGLNYTGETKSDTSRADGPLTTTIDGGKFAKLNPEFKRTPFKEAIEQTLEWHRLRASSKKL
jgi:CDP-6-deoxy-D-xylo-4-hexulose-3-dehydrase